MNTKTNITPIIQEVEAKRLVGKSQMMSLVDFRVEELWNSFLPISIKNTLSADLISMTIYQSSYFIDFDPSAEFEKWAAVEVSEFEDVPADLKTFVLPKGLYAIFHYQGLSSDNSIFRYIFDEWLPNSNYVLDARPNFEVLGEKYKNNNPESEEDIYIPIKVR